MRTMISREILQSIIKDIRDDSFEMERCDKGGQAHGWASRFRAYAGALEGHMPHAQLPTVITKDELIVPDQLREPEDDDGFVPVEPAEGGK